MYRRNKKPESRRAFSQPLLASRNGQLELTATEQVSTMHLTKQMLGIHTRKKVLYLDQCLLSLAFRKDQAAEKAMRRINELVALQLLVVPYSSIHEEETQFYKQNDALSNFIKAVARGHSFEPDYRVEATQVIKAFQAYLASASASYRREERDALSESVHCWAGHFWVDVHRDPVDVERNRRFKKQAIEELVNTLNAWAATSSSFQRDIDIELKDSARIFVENYRKRAARLMAGDFSALLDSPVNSTLVEHMSYILQQQQMTLAEASKIIESFFASEHFASVPSQLLSARLFATFKMRVRRGAFSNGKTAPDRLSGFLYDVQHVATYAPYCDAFFTDRAMADLLNDKNVGVEVTHGCSVFSASNWGSFFKWLDDLEAGMAEDHADGLRWMYPNVPRETR
jgi:hypothetical protein